MYIAAGEGHTTPGDKILDVKPLVTSVICYKFKKIFEIWFYTIFFMILYKYIAPGQGLTTPWGQNFDVNRNILIWSFVACLKKNLFEVWFYTIFFMILYMYIPPGQGQMAPKGQSFDVNKNVLSLHSFVASFKKMSLKSDFIQFFSWFNTCIQSK